jgi:hypothetical protein
MMVAGVQVLRLLVPLISRRSHRTQPQLDVTIKKSGQADGYAKPRWHPARM